MKKGNPEFESLTEGQVQLILEQIATTVNLMVDICRSEAERHGEKDVALTFHAFSTMLSGVGALADHASGCNCVGDFPTWMVGPTFRALANRGSVA